MDFNLEKIAELIKKSKGHLFGRPGNRTIKRTNSLFIDDLKVYANSHEELEVVMNKHGHWIRREKIFVSSWM